MESGKDTTELRNKVSDALLGHSYAECVEVLCDAIGIILNETSAPKRKQVIEEVCVHITHVALREDLQHVEG